MDLHTAENNYVAAYAKWQAAKWANDDKPSLKWKLLEGMRLWKALQSAADDLEKARIG